MRCDHCHEPIPYDARIDARFCRPAHRSAWHRAKDKARADESFALLLKHTSAVLRGAPAAELALIADEMDAFLTRA